MFACSHGGAANEVTGQRGAALSGRVRVGMSKGSVVRLLPPSFPGMRYLLLKPADRPDISER